MSKYIPAATQEHNTSANAPAIPEPGQGKRGEEGCLGYLLRQASATRQLRMERVVAGVGITLPQFLMLTVLRVYPGISDADLARLTMPIPQTMDVTVTNLERSGAITRRPHAVHSRIQHIDTTPDGLALLIAYRERLGSIERDLLKGSSPKEGEVVRRWLAHVTELDSDKPAPQSVRRFFSTAVSDILDFWVAATIARCTLRCI